MNKELHTKAFSSQLLKANSEVSEHSQGDFDKNNSEVKVLLPTKGEEYQNIVSLFTPKQEECWFPKTSHCEIRKDGAYQYADLQDKLFYCPFHHSLTPQIGLVQVFLAVFIGS